MAYGPRLFLASVAVATLLLGNVSQVSAQERTAGGTLENQMTWSTLSTQIKTALDSAKAVDFRVGKVEDCGQLGKVRAPGHPQADTKGCLSAVTPLPTCAAGMVLTSNGTTLTCTTPASPIVIPNCPADQTLTANGAKLVCTKPVPPSALKLTDVEKTACNRGGTHDIVSTCPSGKSLLSCSGGPGDQLEKEEYWVLESDYKNNRCIGHVGGPACYGPYWSQTIVKATCY